MYAKRVGVQKHVKPGGTAEVMAFVPVKWGKGLFYWLLSPKHFERSLNNYGKNTVQIVFNRGADAQTMV